MAELTCPALDDPVDGSPDPCPLCRERADGVCKLEEVNSDAFALGVLAERARWAENVEAIFKSVEEGLDNAGPEIGHQLRARLREHNDYIQAALLRREGVDD